MISLLGMTEDTAAQIKALLPQVTITYADWLNRVQHGFKGKPYDPSKTVWQKIVDLLDGVSAPPPVTNWSVAAPKSPIHDATNLTGVGLLSIGKPGAHYLDYSSTGTFDSAVMLGPECAGTTFERFHLENAASVGNGPGQGRHALYCKAPNVTCLDWYVTGNPKAPAIGSGASVRYANFQMYRFDISFLWGFSLFDDDDAHHAPGFFKIDQGRTVFASSAAILNQSIIKYAIDIGPDVRLYGPTDNVLQVSGGQTQPTARVSKQAQINGKYMTASMFPGLQPEGLTFV